MSLQFISAFMFLLMISWQAGATDCASQPEVCKVKDQTEKSLAVKEACGIGPDVHWRSQQVVDLFVNDPEFYATNTAFIRDFMVAYPNHQTARCVACAVGKPMDPDWEAHIDLRCGEFE